MKVETRDQILFLRADQIIKAENRKNLCILFLESGKKITLDISVEELEKNLKSLTMLKIQRDLWVNINHIEKIDLNLPSFIKMSNSEKLSIDPEYHEIISEYFNTHQI